MPPFPFLLNDPDTPPSFCLSWLYPATPSWMNLQHGPFTFKVEIGMGMECEQLSMGKLCA